MSLVRSVHNYRMYGLTEMYQACRHASIYDIVSCHLCDILILMANHLSQLILVVILIYRCHLNQTAQGSEKPRDLLMAEPYDKSSCELLSHTWIWTVYVRLCISFTLKKVNRSKIGVHSCAEEM